MSRTTGIRINLFWAIPPTTTILLLVNHGWTIVPESFYLPLNAEAVWDWEFSPYHNADDLLSVLKQKETLEEPLGVTLQWKENGVFSVLTIEPKKIEAQLDLYPNKPMENMRYFYPDVTWYLEKLLPPILDYKDNCIEHMEWYWHW